MTARRASGWQVSVADLFQKFDADHSGTLGKRELRKMLTLMRAKLGAEKVAGVAEMTAHLDADGDGSISLEEWVKNIPAELSGSILELHPSDVFATDQVGGKKVHPPPAPPLLHSCPAPAVVLICPPFV